MTGPIGEEREAIERMRAALEQLLNEVLAAGFASADDYNWPKAIADAKAALWRAEHWIDPFAQAISAARVEGWRAAVQRCCAEVTGIWGADLVTTQAALDELLECKPE